MGTSLTDAPRNRPLASGRHARRPLLLALVYGVFLMVIGGMAVALAVLVSALFSAAALSTTVSRDRALVRVSADANLSSADLDPGRQHTGRVTELERQLAALVERGEILHLEVRLPDGTVLLSDKNGLRGRRAHASTAFTSAAAGDPAAGLLAADVAAEAVGLASTGPLLREYLPIISADGEVAAVVGLWRDATPILGRLEAARRDVLLVTAVGGLVQ